MRHAPLAAAITALTLLTACTTTAPIGRDEATAVLTEQAAKWNVGDLPGFVDTYWNGDDLTFLGRSGITRGRRDLLANYQKGYPDADARGVLTFQVVDFWPLGQDHALLLGHYAIAGKRPGQGWFSLVLARQAGRVVILHDHTSEAK